MNIDEEAPRHSRIRHRDSTQIPFPFIFKGIMSRFIDHNEVILDTQTGLMWPRNASLSYFPTTWNEALLFVKELNHSKYSGFNDWKIPNRKELFSLMSHETINPSIPHPHPFINIFNGYYWTSTTCARLPKQAWSIHLGGARVFPGIKDNSLMLWPVRIAETYHIQILQTGQIACYDETGSRVGCDTTGQDGQFQSGAHLTEPRFEEDTHWVFDNATGLTWLKDADSHLGTMDWQGAIDQVAKINSENTYGYADWRLPDIVELESLTDLGRHSPALPTAHPFMNVQEFYWSSTTSMYEPRYAWVLYMRDGAVGVGFKPLTEFYLWPVRKTGSSAFHSH